MAYGTYDETHQRILESGMKMFLEKGFERTNLRDLCAEAGVTTGSFYRHFTSKEDIFSFFVQPAVDEIRKIFAEAEPVCREAARSATAMDRSKEGPSFLTSPGERLTVTRPFGKA